MLTLSSLIDVAAVLLSVSSLPLSSDLLIGPIGGVGAGIALVCGGIRITSQTQHEGAKKFSLEMLWPEGSSEISFFLIYFCRHREVKPKGNAICELHGRFGVLNKKEKARVCVCSINFDCLEAYQP